MTCLVVAIGMAAPAQADAGQDQAFIVSLNAAGITYKDPESAIAAGKSVCNMANQGKTGAEVVEILQAGNPGLTQENAARFTAISAGVYCPAKLPPKQGT
ncbi:hypothetical protein MBOU_19680 [Mycobacterium bourgelatii]|nr:hypothetical protein MBOU_19680 [Mycobacterium bourgelatii]